MNINEIKSQFPIFSKKINGKPLISYSILASLESKVSETWVSTEDKEIKELLK